MFNNNTIVMETPRAISENLDKMLKYRGYTSDFDTDNLHEDLYEEMMSDTVNVYFNPNCKEFVCVKNDVEDKVNVDSVRGFLSFLNKCFVTHGIIVCKQQTSNQVLKEIAGINVELEIFSFSQLYTDIAEHYLVPKHVLLTREQALEVRKAFESPFGLYPKINYSDPMARYVGAKCGDLIKIIRKDGYVVYRFVI